MREVRFDSLAQFLKTGREIEFAFHGKQYSITNAAGFWNFCLDSEGGSTLLLRICPYSKLEYLSEKAAEIDIEGITIRQIFDDMMYDKDALCIL